MSSPGSTASAPPVSPLRSPWPWLGLALGVLLTLVVWRIVHRAETTRLNALQAARSTAMTRQLDDRMVALGQMLRGAAGYLGRGTLPSRSEWRTYGANLDLPTQYPAVLGLSFVEWIPRAELAGHVARMRKEGFPDYEVILGGPLPADPLASSSIIYIEPWDARNQRAFGKDMLADPVRREAMVQARDLGRVALSGPVTLYQETDADRQAGTVLFAPVYQQGLPLDTVDQRRRALRGWTTFPMRMGDLIRSVLAQDLRTMDLALADDTGQDGAISLFDSDPGHSADERAASRVQSIAVAGRTWRIAIHPNASFYAEAGQPRHWEILLGGLVASLLFFTVLVTLHGAEGRAQALARFRGEAARATEAQFRALFELAPFGMAIVDSSSGRLLSVNGCFSQMLGYTPAELMEHDFQGNTHPDHLAADLASIRDLASGAVSEAWKEKRYLHRDGHAVWARLSLVRLPAIPDMPPRHMGIAEDITNRHQADLRLKEAVLETQRFRDALDHVSAYVYIKDRQSRYLYANPATLKLFGCSAEELVGCDDTRFFPPDTVKRLQAIDTRVFQGEATTEEIVVANAQGKPRVYLEAKTPLYADPERTKITGLLGISTDISERTQTLDALSESEARFRTVVEESPVAIFLHREGHFTFLNPAALRLFRASRQGDLLGTPVLDRIHPDDLDLVRKRIAQGYEHGYPNASLEQRLIALDGTIVEAEAQACPVTYSGQAHLMVFAQDITVRKKIMAELQESETRFRTLADSAPVFIWTSDTEGGCSHINQAWTDWTGQGIDQALGNGWTTFLHRDDLQVTQAAYQGSVAARLPFAMEFRLRHHSGTYRWISDRGVPRFAADGVFLGYIGAGIDIQDRKAAEAAILESELRARKAESLVLMAGGIAHDFNNLFQSLQGNLEVVGMRAQGNPFLTEPLNRALGALNRAVSLSWKMLDFSGHGFVQPLQLSLETWLPAYVETLRLEFPPAFDLQLACEPAPPIKGDRSKLEQVLKAILDNALEAAATSASQIRLRLFVDFGADRPGPESPGVWPLRRPQVPATVCLEIADDGPGVPPEHLDLICDPFFTTRDPGRGLGLPAAVGILTAHRAGLHILNREGGGLVLRLHFPPGGA